MMKKKRSLSGSLFTRRAKATLALGAALSIGGVSEVIDGVHFVVRKDLDGVKVVENGRGKKEVVATLTDGFAANSLFKLSRALPDTLVSRQNDLFTPTWMPKVAPPQVAGVTVKRDVFHEEIARINGSIRQDFFANAVPFGDLIHEKAMKYDVDPALVAAVVETESRFRAKAHSQVGARGLMQLMPRTGRWLGARNLYDPEQNVEAGAKYLNYLQKRFDGNLTKAIAAYNGGEGNVKRYNGVPPFRETRSYVSKVLSRYQQRNHQLKQYQEAQRGGGGAADGVVTIR
jgi:hypothetical protein